MLLAIPVWEGRVSPVLDSAGRLLLIRVEEGREMARSEMSLPPGPIPSRVLRIREQGVELLVCGAVSRPMAEILHAAGLQLIPWVSGPMEEVIAAFLAGRLLDPRYTMPGCGRRCRGGRGGGRGGGQGGGRGGGRGHGRMQGRGGWSRNGGTPGQGRGRGPEGR